MESAQRELLCVLLRRLNELGLIDKATCMGAEDLVHSGMEIPRLFRCSVCMTGEDKGNERMENTE